MKLKLDINNALLKAGKQIVELLNKNGHEAFWVGGTVRDLILKRPIDNLDIATSAKPDEVEKILENGKIRSTSSAKKYGTILAFPKGLNIEITTFRAEGRYSDRRHPDSVKFINDYQSDAQRRDFTINGLYLDVKSGEVLDVVGGLADIKRKLIKFIGNPKHRIDEDALRMLRAVRFAVTLGFKIEKNSFAAIKTRAKFIQDVSGERIKAELDKVLSLSNREQGFRLLDEIGLLKFLISDFPKLKQIVHNSREYHLEGSVFEHTLKTINFVTDLNEIYAMLFHDLGKIKLVKKVFTNGAWVNKFSGHNRLSAELFDKFAKRMRFGRQEKRLVNWLVLHHDDRLMFRQAKLRKQVEYVLHPFFRHLYNVWYADSMGNIRLLEHGKVGVKPSATLPIVEEILNKLNSKKDLIKKFANGDVVMQHSKIKTGIEVQRKIFDVVEKIYLNQIKNESDLENFLQKNRKNA